MFIIFIRVLIIYITVLIFLRLMGKRQIGEMQPYEVVITLIIADLATLPMGDTNIPLLNGILPLAVLVLVHYIITFFTRKSIIIRRIMSGKPVVVINQNGIEYSALQELNMNIDDVLEMLRQCGYYSFDQVLYAIIETNGKMSVIPTSENAPATAKDVGVINKPANLPYILISDGKIMKNQISELELSIEKLDEILKHFKIKKINDVLILSMNKSGKIYLQEKRKNYIIVENIYKELAI